ncbi:MAG: hypothetical protein L6R40_008402, partial [Gallowayella cf. fulva]
LHQTKCTILAVSCTPTPTPTPTLSISSTLTSVLLNIPPIGTSSAAPTSTLHRSPMTRNPSSPPLRLEALHPAPPTPPPAPLPVTPAPSLPLSARPPKTRRQSSSAGFLSVGRHAQTMPVLLSMMDQSVESMVA